MSPTQRTLKVLREKENAIVDIVERYNSFIKTRHDCFNMFDLIAIRNGEIVGIQVTSASNHQARVKKIQDNPISVQWILAGGIIEVRTWGKRGPRGKRKQWTERIEQITV